MEVEESYKALGSAPLEVAEFKNIAEEAFNAYFVSVAQLLSTGHFQTSVPDPVPSFPSMMIITAMPRHFAVELVGAQRDNRKLRIVSRKLDDPGVYFGQFNYPADAPAMVEMQAAGNGVAALALITPDAMDEMNRRFPGVSDAYPTHIISVGGAGPALRFTDTANYFRVENVLLGNAFDSAVRIRHIRFALVVRKDSDVDGYRAFLAELLRLTSGRSLVGADLIPGDKAEIVIRAGQFANVFLMNQLHETSIGAFIDQHRDVLLSALEARNLVSEPHLPWIVESPDAEEQAINPDLFVQRSDGHWDVYDLKLALLHRKDVTTGKRNRRRFVYTVEDGFAQLAHYRDFLSIPEHAAEASALYGATFESPRFVLVVGNYENVDMDKVVEARRRFPALEIIDYDTILQLYLMHNNAIPGIQQPRQP